MASGESRQPRRTTPRSALSRQAAPRGRHATAAAWWTRPRAEDELSSQREGLALLRHPAAVAERQEDAGDQAAAMIEPVSDLWATRVARAALTLLLSLAVARFVSVRGARACCSSMRPGMCFFGWQRELFRSAATRRSPVRGCCAYACMRVATSSAQGAKAPLL